MNRFHVSSPKPAYHHTKRRIKGCCLLVLVGLFLTICAVCGLTAYLIRRAEAQTPTETPLHVLLLIDNSNSMYEKGGLGSDPALLRIEAARLFITYLGVDSGALTHHLGVIFFGEQAHLRVPLTPLTDAARRADVVQLIADPPRMGWTNPQTALDLAAETLLAKEQRHVGRAVVLLTDGKPELCTNPTAEEKAAVVAQLRERARRFAAEDISLFIILLENAATDADPEIASLFIPLWQEMAQNTPAGRFYHARRSEELLGIYHDIVVTLTGRQTAGVVVQAQVMTPTVKQIPVEPGLAQVTFVVRKSDPTLQVTVFRPDGRPLAVKDSGVHYGGRPGQSREEVWAVDNPLAGSWQVRLNGQGTVTVWKDFYPAVATPTPIPTCTPTRTPTASPISSPFPTATHTPLPMLTFTPTSMPTLTPTPPPSSVGQAGRWRWWWAGLGVILLGGGGSWLWLRHRRSSPLLEGSLRRLTAPAGQAVPSRLDLDVLRRREVHLGPEVGADLRLPDAPDAPTPSVRLSARRDPADSCVAVLTSGPAVDETRQVLVNSLPLLGEYALRDGDVMTLGAYRFRYENVRRRPPARRPGSVMRDA